PGGRNHSISATSGYPLRNRQSSRAKWLLETINRCRHPWDIREVKALAGDAGFAALRQRVFEVEYFDAVLKTKKKTSITPCIDFDLGDEPGYGSPDASTGIGKDDFSMRWT